MSVINNREAFLPTEPEIDVSQFRKTALDLKYGESPNQILDIFYPDEGEGPYPLIIIFHGGAFCAGHKRSYHIAAKCLPIHAGYAIASIEYRLTQEAIWPAQLIDGKLAIRYLRAHAKELNLDTDKFAVWGVSAGGTITQVMALTGDKEEYDDLSIGEKASSKVQCAVAWYTISEFNCQEQFGFDIFEERKRTGAGKGMMPGGGESKDSMFTRLLGYNPLLYPERTCKISPVGIVNKSCPPMLIQHGTNDLVIDYHQSIYMYEKIKDVCGEGVCELDLFEGEPHSSKKIKSVENVNRCLDFLDKHLLNGNNPYRKELTPIKIVGED